MLIPYKRRETKVIDHRANIERRQQDFGPPKGCFERRHHAERRLPIAGEAVLSDDDFAKFFGAAVKSSNTNDYLLDQSSEVFDRVRDGY